MLKNVSDIPIIESKMKTLSNKIRGRYKPKKRRNVVKKEIVDLKKDISKLSKQVTNINQKKKKQKIDTQVDALVDTDFDDFLNNIKVSVSNMASKKEKELNEKLKNDLEIQHNKFKKKYSNLMENFAERKKELALEFEKKYKEYFMNNYLKQFTTNQLPTVQADATVFDLAEAKKAKAQKFIDDNQL